MSPAELLAPDLVRMAFVLGMVLSVLLYEKSHLTTGSIVVPGFLGVLIFEPLVMMVTIFNAVVCYWVVHQIAPRFFLIPAKVKFYALVITSVLIQLLLGIVANQASAFAENASLLSGLGFVIPGLIAHDMARNGVLKTASNTLAVSVIVGGILFFWIFLFPNSTLNAGDFARLPFSFELALMLAISTIGSVLLKLNSSIRSAGFVTAAYLVFFSPSPLVLVALFFAATATYLVCCNLLIPSMIIFGRRKFALMLMVGSIVMWGVLLLLKWAGIPLAIADHPLYAGILILVPGLIANEVQRTSVLQVSSGLGLMTAWIFAFGRLYHELQTFVRPSVVLPLSLCLIGILLLMLCLKSLPFANPSSPNLFLDRRVTT